MLVLLAIGIIAGMLLGLLFKVLVLVPAMLIATAVITMLGFAKGLGFEMIALILFGAAVSLQVGYIVGAFIATAATSIRYDRRLLKERPWPSRNGRAAALMKLNKAASAVPHLATFKGWPTTDASS